MTEVANASVVENVQFSTEVSLSTLLQGAFVKKPRAVAAAARVGADERAILRVARLRRKYGPGPVLVRDLGEPALLILSREDVRRVLENSAGEFAADPPGKKRGMAVFQPDGLAISRGADWLSRRRFTEAVLNAGMAEHAQGFLMTCREEVACLVAESPLAEPVRGAGTPAGTLLGWPEFHAAFKRIARRVVLGDAARGDEGVSRLLTELMLEANSAPKQQSEASQARFDRFMAHIRGHVADAEPGGLVSLFDRAPRDAATCPAGQVPHWLFGIQDTLTLNVYRALALIAAHPQQLSRVERELADGDPTTPDGITALTYLTACLQEAMRLWPTTALMSRVTVTETVWNGAVIPPETKVLIYSGFHHRDRRYYDFADRFAPEVWLPGGPAIDDWCFNQLGHGQQDCPGRDLALFLGIAVLAELLTRYRPLSLDWTVEPGRPLPYQLNPFPLRFELIPRTLTAGRGRHRQPATHGKDVRS